MISKSHKKNLNIAEHSSVVSDAVPFDRLETLLKNLPGMAYRCLNLPHWPMAFVSDGCFDLCGYHRHEIESQTVLWGDFTHPEMINDVDRQVREGVDQSKPFEVEYRIITRDGQEKWVWERGRVIDFNEDGIAILEGFITDITDRKQAENSLKQAEAFAQAIVDSAVEAVISIDKSGNILSFNQSASTIFGHSLREISGTHARQLVASGFYREFDRYFNDCQENQLINQRGIELRGYDHNQREFPMHLSMQRIVADDEFRYVILIRDLTDQRAAEKEAREQRDTLAHVDRLNTLGEMAAGIAHEINQPLTAISMYAQSAIRFTNQEQFPTDRLRTILDKLSQQAHRAGAVIERMQELTRPRDSHYETVDTHLLLNEIHQLAEVEAHIQNFIIVLRLDKNLPAVSCDRVQIQQVILNLLRNGMESMKSARCKAGSKIVLETSKTDNQVAISIIDSGLGISRQMEKQLYQPFATSKESGMGLGLSISRSIIAAHGGQLAFKNNRNQGATFYFSLDTKPQ